MTKIGSSRPKWGYHWKIGLTGWVTFNSPQMANNQIGTWKTPKIWHWWNTACGGYHCEPSIVCMFMSVFKWTNQNVHRKCLEISTNRHIYTYLWPIGVSISPWSDMPRPVGATHFDGLHWIFHWPVTRGFVSQFSSGNVFVWPILETSAFEFVSSKIQSLEIWLLVPKFGATCWILPVML